jgi:4,5-DOPA dioxygenase extradiol
MQDSTALMPVLFVGHGSPENVLNENAWTKSLKETAKKIPRPEAIVVISAHWLTQSLKITSNPTPELIYDFYGFPQPLYSVKYPCEGNPDLAEKIASLLKTFEPQLDSTRGFDHGTWTVLYHLYPKADIPVVQISLSSKLQYTQYLEVGQKLSALREQNVLIVGSGNVVHNLRQLQQITSPPFDWAISFDNWVKSSVSSRKYQNLALLDDDIKKNFELAHPTPDHYLPLLICCGAAREKDVISFPFEDFQYGSISMRNIFWS